jgi:hypothetical protein
MMGSFLHKLFRGAILGMMLLLAGTANLVCLSFDADDDEDTPPVSVELNIVAPCKKSIQLPKPHAHARTFRLWDEKPATTQLASITFEAPILLHQESPQLLVPLRT